MRALILSVVAGGGLAFTLPASADDSFNTATFGLVLSIPVGGDVPQFGLGVAASVMHYPDDDLFYTGVGGFVQAQYLFGGGWRASLGFQPAAAITGAELGLAVVSRRGEPVALGLHLAPYLSGGYGTVAFRYTPLLTHPGRTLDVTVAGNLWFDFRQGVVYEPYHLRLFQSTPGRPLVTDGAPRVAPLVARADWGTDRSPPAAPLADDVRRAAADAWARAMLDEHAAVAAFARAALQLMALGAPADLVARAHRAALDEVDHARRCAALAGRFAGADVGPGPLPEACAPLAALDHAALAAATLREGCLGEGVAARLARASLACADDPAVREALAAIARDEADHARLAWDVVAWCVAAGGAAARDAVAEALRTAPQAVASGDVDPRLEGLGVAGASAQRSAYARERRAVLRRWHALGRAA